MSWLVDLFRVLSAASTMLMLLSLIPTAYQIHKARTVGHMSITPLATMLVNCHLWLTYGFLTSNYVPLVATFLPGEVLSVGYLTAYYHHAHDRGHAIRIITVCTVVIAMVTTYAVLGSMRCTGQTHTGVASTMGYIGTTSAVLLYGSPFEDIAKVVRYRSGVFIPITMVSVGIVGNIIWVVYCLLIADSFLLVTNAFLLAMGLIQAPVYWAFHPATHPLPHDYAEALKPKDVELGDDACTSAPSFVSLRSFSL